MHDIAGTIGVMLVLGSYLLLQTGSLSAADWRYSTANAGGALLLLASLAVDFNLPAFLIESCWLAISLYALVRDLGRRRVRSAQ